MTCSATQQVGRGDETTRYEALLQDFHRSEPLTHAHGSNHHDGPDSDILYREEPPTGPPDINDADPSIQPLQVGMFRTRSPPETTRSTRNVGVCRGRERRSRRPGLSIAALQKYFKDLAGRVFAFSLKVNTVTVVIDADRYVPLRSPDSGHVYDMSRVDARRVFDHTIAALPERVEALSQLAEQNGYDNDPAGWTRLIDDHAEREPAESTEPYELTPLWRSIVLDVSLAMSDLLIQRGKGQLKWKFYAGSKKSFDFHHPVIVGFTQAAKSYQVDLYRPITNMSLKAAADDGPMRDLAAYLDYIAGDI